MTELEIWDEINNSWDRMSLPLQRLWEVIKINPEIWHQESDDDKRRYWVVAIYGNTVIWYDDIEDGFNRSSYKIYGQIQEYGYNQDNLEWTLELVMDEIKSGIYSVRNAGPPVSID